MHPIALSAPGDDIAGLDEGLVLAFACRQHLVRHAAELVDVELVIGEQHVVLEIFRRRRGVVLQPVQRIIDTRRGERRKRMFRTRRGLVFAVDDGVVHHRDIGHVEIVPQRPPQIAGDLALHVGLVVEGEMQRDRLVGFADDHRHTVIADQQADLVGQIAFEEVGTGDRRAVPARSPDETVGEPRIEPGMRMGLQPDVGIAGAHPSFRRLAGDHRGETVAQERRVAGEYLLQPGDSRLRVVEGLVCDPRRALEPVAACCRMDVFHVGSTPHFTASIAANGKDGPYGREPRDSNPTGADMCRASAGRR